MSDEHNIRVLVADDSEFMRHYVRDILQNEGGFDVVSMAQDGMEALHLYKEFMPDVVTMDLVMDPYPGEEGIMAILEIDPDARICVVSSMGNKFTVEECLKMGAKDFVVKPFDPKELVEKLKTIARC